MASEQIYKCPNCGYEYEPWVQVCPDCGTHLGAYPRSEGIKGSLDTDTDPQWTIVINVPNAILGSFIKVQLEDAGIPVLMFRSRSADIAEFSHNDFVPMDLLVPKDRVREARELVDSPPGDLYGPSDIDYEGSGEFDLTETTTISGVPEGWQMLPTESDLHARQLVRRTHGEILKGWYWSDDKTQPVPEPPARERDWLDEYDPYYDDSPAYTSSNYRQSAGEDWGKPKPWVKVVYGILLLVISLPFLLQILGHLWAILGTGR